MYIKPTYLFQLHQQPDTSWLLKSGHHVNSRCRQQADVDPTLNCQSNILSIAHRPSVLLADDTQHSVAVVVAAAAAALAVARLRPDNPPYYFLNE